MSKPVCLVIAMGMLFVFYGSIAITRYFRSRAFQTAPLELDAPLTP